MKLLTPADISALTGLNYAKSLMLIKSMNHLQIGNRYFVSMTTLKKFLDPDVPMLIEEEEK